ncbi:hypothetical protein AAY72_03725 [Alishewanella sp. WH16-1]|jgi:hypothetical protein|uniref:hypothetical protein n=1 Tax=Alishewanella sp. WH16-1 TaxID=1651088 RepID=UPI00070D1272|nr:hypothetical protein [Alishewanella sp. WH16-1]KRS22360.1 hypothetical protein AAY72_03725 [Alishewanella sp. WH16-1]
MNKLNSQRLVETFEITAPEDPIEEQGLMKLLFIQTDNDAQMTAKIAKEFGQEQTRLTAIFRERNVIASMR